MLVDILELNLIEELGLDKLPVEKREALLKQMTDTLESRLGMVVFAELSYFEKRKLKKMLSADEDVDAFLRSRINNFKTLVTGVVAEFKQEILGMQAEYKKLQGL